MVVVVRIHTQILVNINSIKSCMEKTIIMEKRLGMARLYMQETYFQHIAFAQRVILWNLISTQPLLIDGRRMANQSQIRWMTYPLSKLKLFALLLVRLGERVSAGQDRCELWWNVWRAGGGAGGGINFSSAPSDSGKVKVAGDKLTGTVVLTSILENFFGRYWRCH